MTSVRMRIDDEAGFLSTGTPVLGWAVADADDWLQQDAEIQIRRATGLQSVVTGSAESQGVPWPVAPIGPYDGAGVRVRVQGTDGGWTPFSDWIEMRTGPLAGGWTAPFIAAAGVVADRGTVRFRTEIAIRGPVRRALLSTTAHGVLETVVNGVVVGDEVLAPGWTAYRDRLLFRTADVSAMLHEGRNVLAATVAEGWYRERFGFDGDFHIAYPGPVALSAQLRIEYEDGAVDTVVSDGAWESTTSGPTTSASIYQGEHYDARLVDGAFADPDEVLPDAAPAVVVDAVAARIEPADAPPIRRIERMPAQAFIESPSGGRIIDFGQNLVGWLEIRHELPEGTELVLRHAEVLEHGELGVRPLRFAAATDRYIAPGGPAVWSPRFTFHGFRYAQIDGWEPGPDGVVAVVIHSDLVRTGTFESSDPMLNKLHENVVWGMRGNFVGIPTDCPQRDERLGWTGDLQVFAPTASYLFDVRSFLASWLTDLALEQSADGHVPMVVPSPLTEEPAAVAVWGDSASLVPDTLFERYGERRVLERQYASMRKWVEAERSLAGEDLLWTGTFQLGDWLDPSAPPDNPAAAKTDGDLIASAYFVRSTERLAAAAQVLGLTADAEEYGALAAAARAAFRREYVTPAGRVLSDAHTAYGVAIVFGLLDGDERTAAGNRLAELVRAYGYRVRTGFVGTPLICDALTVTGHVDTAYRLLLERGDPSWLYPITMGATTIWERWDSMLPDGSINPGEMTSFNHYALGAVADWMHRTIGGIALASPGYRRIRIAPQPGGGLTSATAALETGYGRVATDWSIADGVFRLTAVVPPGTTATVVLPDGSPAREVGSGTHEYRVTLPAEAAPEPLTMDSPLAAFGEDPEVRSALEAFFAEVGYYIGLGWSGSGRWRSDATLSGSLMMFRDENRPALEALVAGFTA